MSSASDSDDLTAVDILKIDTDGYELGDIAWRRERSFTLSRRRKGHRVSRTDLVGRQRVLQRRSSATRAWVLALQTGNGTLCAFSPSARVCLRYSGRRITKGSLPGADALYARDVADTQYASRHGFAANSDQRRNLALMLDLYGLEDMAAELLLATPGLFDGGRKTARRSTSSHRKCTVWA